MAVGQIEMVPSAAPPSPPAALPQGDHGRHAIPAAHDQHGTFGTAIRSTPGRMTTTLTVLFLVVLVFGLLAVTGAAQRRSATDHVRASSGPLTVQAEILYRSMSDADATAATAFLSAGAEPPALRSRYLDDIAAAGSALVAASTGDIADRDALGQISTELPVYTGLVETARADNRLGLPLGAAYLREASALMRSTLLPSADTLYRAQAARLESDRDDAAGSPWIAIPLGIIVLIGLISAQRTLARRTRRVVNPGLLAATILVIGALGCLTVSWAVAQGHLGTARDTGSSKVEAFSTARIAVLRARADEALTLVARGSGGAYEKDFGAATATLTGSGGRLAAAQSGANATERADAGAAGKDLARWQSVHTAIRHADDGGRYPDAVALAIGSGPDDSPATFASLDADLGRGIDAANTAFDHEAGLAASAQNGIDIAAGVLVGLALIGLSVGFQRRIAEYR